VNEGAAFGPPFCSRREKEFFLKLWQYSRLANEGMLRLRRMLKRDVLEKFVRRKLSEAEWRDLSQALQALDDDPQVDAILVRAAERGASLESLLAELAKRDSSPKQSES
jgi:hypothetical protein